MSAGLNTVAGTIYEDFIDPWMPESNKETKAANIMKVQRWNISWLLLYFLKSNIVKQEIR